MKEKHVSGYRLLLILLVASNYFLMIYLFFSFRYNETFLNEIGIEFKSPFFTVEDRWMDFINPILYAWNLEPYTAYYGNSPPFMMLLAFVLSIPIKLGCSKYGVYLAFYFVLMIAAGKAIYSILVYNCIGKLESILITLFGLSSFPFGYCFDRGNYIFVAAVVIIWFIYAYEREHYYRAAILVGIAAALKIHPALLGTVFLADKRIREAIVCALTGIGLSILPLFCFKDGFSWNLNEFLHKSESYTKMGNKVLAWLVDDKNSFYQLILVPKMMSKNPLSVIEQVIDFVSIFKVGLTFFLIIVVLICLILQRNYDRILILTMMMLGFPIESGVYNLVIAVFPIIYWCSKEKENRVMPVLGTLLITMKSFLVIQEIPVMITVQAILNPLLELMIIIYIILLRREEYADGLRKYIKRKSTD